MQSKCEYFMFIWPLSDITALPTKLALSYDVCDRIHFTIDRRHDIKIWHAHLYID